MGLLFSSDPWSDQHKPVGRTDIPMYGRTQPIKPMMETAVTYGINAQKEQPEKIIIQEIWPVAVTLQDL